MISNRVEELLSVWEFRRANGEVLTPEDLCPDDPELAAELRWAVNALEQIESRFGIPASPDSADGRSAEVPGTTPEVPHHIVDVQTRFEVERLHAAGGLGRVFVASDKQLNRRVAIKFPLSSRLSPQARIRFRREADVTSRLDHPGIVPVHAISDGDVNRPPCYVMRFVEGQTLQEAIDRLHGEVRGAGSTVRAQAAETIPGADAGEQLSKPAPLICLSLRDLLQRFVTVCNIVAFAHSKGVIHRDIKPANILLGDFGETLVLDWGLAKIRGEIDEAEIRDVAEQLLPTEKSQVPGLVLTRTGEMLGTPAFASPEQLLGRISDVDERSDVYSLGATLFRLLTGEPLFRSDELPRHLEQIRSGAIQGLADRLRQISPALSAICRKALAVVPENRYHGALELARDVELYLRDERISIPCETLLQRALRWLRTHPRATTGIGAGLAGAFSVAVAASIALNERNTRLDSVNSELSSTNSRLSDAVTVAESSREQALRALRSLSDDVLASMLQQTSQLSRQQSGYLERVLAEYAAFASVSGDSEESRLLRAEGLYQCGGIRAALQQFDAAQQELTEAAQILSRLDATTHTGDIRRRLILAKLRLAGCLSQMQQLQPAAQEIQNALQLAEQQAGAAAAGHRERLLLAQVLLRLAENQRQRGHYPESLATGLRAESIIELLTETDCDDPELIPTLGRIMNGIEQSAFESIELRENAEYSGRALALWNKLSDKYPDDSDCQLGLAQSEAAAQRRASSKNDLAGVITHSSRGFEILEKYLLANPDSIRARSLQSELLTARGAACRQQGDIQSADQDLILAAAIGRTVPAATLGEPRELHQYFWTQYQILLNSGSANQRDEFRRMSQNLVRDLRGAIPKLEARFHDDFLHLLARTQLSSALYLSQSGQNSEADQLLTESYLILDELVKKTGQLGRFGYDLIDVIRRQAERSRAQGDPGSAEQKLTRIQSLAQQLMPEGPVDERSNRCFGNLYAEQGLLFHALGREHDAVAAYRKAIELRQRQLEWNSLVENTHIVLAGTHCNLGNALNNLKQFNEALKEYNAADAILTARQTSAPPSPLADVFLWNTRCGRGDTLRELGRYQESLADFDWVHSQHPEKFNATLKINRARTLAFLNQAAAVADAKTIVRAPGDRTYSAIAIVAVFAIAAERTADNAVKEEAQKRAMDLLRTLESDGELKSEINRRRLKEATDLNGLRDLPEFAELRERVAPSP